MLLAYLAATLGVPKSAVILKSCQASRRKVVLVSGAEASAILALATNG
jgi:uncharacterized protein YggU (UPF0235/DUF167 family)